MGAAESWDNDDVLVLYVRDDDPEPRFGLIVDKVTGGGFEAYDGPTKERFTFSLYDTPSDRFSVKHHYAVWEVDYSSLTEAFLYVCFRLNYWRILRQQLYDFRLNECRDRYRVLGMLIEFWRKGDEPDVSLDDLLSEVYGSRIRTSRKNYEYAQRLRNLVRSWKDSGAIELEHSGPLEEVAWTFKVTPRAIAIFDEHQRDASRHAESRWFSKWGLWLAFVGVVGGLIGLALQCDS